MLRWLRGGIRGLSAAKTIAAKAAATKTTAAKAAATKTTATKTTAGKTIAGKAAAGKTIAAKTTAAKAVAPRRAPQQYIDGDQDWSRMPDLIGDDVVDSWTALSRTGAASSGASAAAPAAASELQTVGDVFRYAITEFSREEHALAYGQGSVDATDEAHLLLMMHLNLPLSSTGAFMRQWGKSRLMGAEMSALLALITKRVRDKVPVAYLCKGCFQQGEKLYVDERCLIPRSHIGELLAPKSRFFLFKDNIAIRNESTSTSKSKRGPRAPGPLEPLPISLRSVRSVLDLCTGSGALAILAHRTLLQHNEDPGLVVHAADISSAALDVARINLQRKQLTSAIHLFCGDLWAALPPNAPLYDLVLCNPPYVDDAAMAALPSEYKQEPELALRGGSTGLALVCRIVEGAAQRLSSEGRLVLECGAAGRRLRGAVAVTGGQWWRTSNSDNEVLVLSRSQSEALAAKLSREWRQ